MPCSRRTHRSRSRPRVSPAALTLALALASAGAALAAAASAGAVRAPRAAPLPATIGLELPALANPATHAHREGKIVWLDLVVPALAPEEQFYSGLFGWSFREVQSGEHPYAIASLQGEPIAGLLQQAPPAPRARSAWLPFISVREIDAVKRRALAHGARLLVDVRDYRQRGRQAILSDPEGAAFGILQSSQGDPPDLLASPGRWIWSSLLAREPGREAGFYQTLFGYDVFAVDGQPAELVLSSQGYARAGIDPFSDAAGAEAASAEATRAAGAGRPARWLSFVRVADLEGAMQRATMLGGKVLVQPRSGRSGRIAVIADPDGAAVGLMQWSPQPDGAAGGPRG